MQTYISVIGLGAENEELNDVAYEVGRLVAERGAIVVCGGLGGVMNAVAQGAKEAGGTTVGILPGPDRRGASEYLDIAIPTDMAHARNALVVRSGDAVIAIGAGYGTLSEIGLALKMGKPVVGLKSWTLYREGKQDTGIIAAETADKAVELAFKAIKA
ncbi:MAG: TIGR00725 family protein [Candidatus Aquicultor secundus]|uniref:TIGR00725 family protein n=1 Tax=Candidatus Aquicultor secundus TaxID=1973895 RepID=A0A2M7T6L4_9ACTN|nr:TIGR00725 family protein [Candidatus Aquicultor secundus]NCO66274.1 TIGR00725 family protein [Solirubrobacter sp.]OIO87567.1 MAG: TIGR00725 family protein [Candidatus Aquicultor secundus]PIU26720.1 MAG: TIGR00725 family protein [Candidatus Aquicultor secundus]PIW21775.1 MAG: TIGR00725 family protein [Candidatus Aquicultor secundus]PIX53203.1 MAG: TIGR00725 family protein [Candidatus Aquicultor secundus]